MCRVAVKGIGLPLVLVFITITICELIVYAMSEYMKWVHQTERMSV